MGSWLPAVGDGRPPACCAGAGPRGIVAHTARRKGTPRPSWSRSPIVNHEASAEASELRHLYLIDGSGFIFRAFHALPPLTRSDGTPVNAVLGFSNMLWKILRETDADHAAVIFDTARLTFRNEIYEPYKANRGETPEELIPQFPLVREAAAAFNLASIELEGFEADDLIAAYADAARAQGARVTIVSADKDLMQLVDADSVVMYDYFKNREIGPEQVRERFGVGPGTGDRRAGACRRQHRQRAGRPRHRGQDGGATHQRLWRPRPTAGARRRDQAAQAAPEPDRACRDGTHLARSRDAAAGCAAADAAGGARTPPAGAWRAPRLLPGERLPVDRRPTRLRRRRRRRWRRRRQNRRRRPPSPHRIRW